MSLRKLMVGGVLFFLIPLGSLARANATFSGVGDLPGGLFFSVVRGISADGTSLVGVSETSSPSGGVAFKWSSVTGIDFLLPNVPNFAEIVIGLSDDGNHTTRTLDTNPDEYWYVTLDPPGLVRVTPPASQANFVFRGISGDGQVVVADGTASTPFGLQSRAHRWFVATETFEELTVVIENGGVQVRGASEDGGTVAGWADTVNGREAAIWDGANSITILGDLPGGNVVAEGSAVSADGGVVVGRGNNIDGKTEAWIWRGNGLEALGGLDDSHPTFLSGPSDISADGVVVVGGALTAFVWDERNGMRDLRDMLISDYGLASELSGWTLGNATAVSGDGLVIAGNGTNPQGDVEGWIVTLPDADGDRVPDADDNCPFTANARGGGTCTAGTVGDPCTADSECDGAVSGVCSIAQEDADSDGLGDACDNCIAMPNGPDMPDKGGNMQIDTDGDGCGNLCDGDFDQNLPVVALADLIQMRAALGHLITASDCPDDGGAMVSPCEEFDVNGDALPIIGIPDLTAFRLMLGFPPGPSGLVAFCNAPQQSAQGGGGSGFALEAFSSTAASQDLNGDGVEDLEDAFILIDKLISELEGAGQ